MQARGTFACGLQKIEYHSMQARGTFFLVVVENRVTSLCRLEDTWVVEIEYHFMQARGHVVCRKQSTTPMQARGDVACGLQKIEYHSMQARGTFSTWVVEIQYLFMQARSTRGCKKQSTTLCRPRGHVVCRNRVPLYVGQRDTWVCRKQSYHSMQARGRLHVVVEIEYHSMQARGRFPRGCRNIVPFLCRLEGPRGCRKQSTTLCRLEDTWLQKQSTTLCRPRGDTWFVENRVPLYVGQRDVFTSLQKIELPL